MDREELAAILLLPDEARPSVAVIDVRGHDHVGGHIHGSTHVPSNTLDHRLPELVRKLKDTELVVFHCALSQERGPRAALRYRETREKTLAAGERNANETVENEGGGSEGTKPAKKQQQILVLDGGFVEWQKK